MRTYLARSDNSCLDASKVEKEIIGSDTRERASRGCYAVENPVDGNGDPNPSAMRGSRDR